MKDFGDRFFITGIDTDVGKTVVSSVLVEAFSADYWKPVQCGDLEQSDTMKVRSLISVDQSQCHPETHRFRHPVSPHLAAEREGKKIELEHFKVPETRKPLIIEGAGGVLVPLNERAWIVDLARRFGCRVLLVSRNILGSLNHTFLSIEALQRRGLEVSGLIFNGDANEELENFVERRSRVPIWFRMPREHQLSPEVISSHARRFRENLKHEFRSDRSEAPMASIYSAKNGTQPHPD